MTHLNGLLAGIAAMVTAVIGLLTYLDDSGKLENPVGRAVTEVAGGSAEANTGGGTGTTGTTDTTESQAPAVESLTVDADGCDIIVDWVATGASGGLVLFRDGEPVDELPVEPGSTDESVLDTFGEGPYEAHYELVAFDADGDETDSASASDADVCIG
jgi:hypothetical protein